MGDAVAVGDDQRRSLVGLRLAQRPQGLLGVGAHCHPGDVDVAIGDRLQGEVLLGNPLAGGGELGHRAERRRLGGLPAGVGVDLGVEDQHVDVATARQHVVQSAGPDVVGPAVAADDPDAAPHQLVDHAAQVDDGRIGLVIQGVQTAAQLVDPRALGGVFRLPALGRTENLVDQLRPDLLAQPDEALAGQRPVLVGGQPEPEAELCVVLEQRVGPGRPPARGVDRPGGGGQVAAVDRGAAGGVGDHQAVAEELREELQVGGLPAARAGSGELEERLQELGTAHRLEVHPGAIGGGQGLEEGDVAALAVEPRFAPGQVDRLVLGVGGRRDRAGLHAEAASGAVLEVDHQGESGTGQPARGERHGGEAFWSRGQQRLVVELGPDHAVRADEAAVAALDAEPRVPGGDLVGDVALLIGRGPARVGAVDREDAHRQVVAVSLHHRGDDRADEFRGVRGDRRAHLAGCGDLTRDLDPMQRGDGRVHGSVVAGDHLAPAPGVALGDGLLDRRYRLLLWHHPGDGEETGLENGVDPVGETGLTGNAVGVDHVEGDPLGQDPLLDLLSQRVPDLGGRRRGVEQQGGAGCRALEHLRPLDQRRVVAADEPGRVDQVRGPDGVRPETEVGGGLRAGLLGVVDEVPLGVAARVLAEDLDGVLVGADGTVRAEAEEEGAERPRRLDVQAAVVREAGPAHVVVDADREAGARLITAELGEDTGHHPRGHLLRGEPVTATDDHRHGPPGARAVRLGERAQHVQEERLAERPGLLGAVEHRHPARARRDRGEQCLSREGPVEAKLDHPHLLALGGEIRRGLGGGLGTRAHGDDHALGVRIPVVLDQVVAAAGALRHRVHGRLHGGGDARVERVDRLARLEVDVRVLGRAADEGSVRRECPVAMRPDELGGDQGAEVVVGEGLDGVQLVRGPEAVEEVDERDPGAEGRHLGDRREVMALLHRGGRQQREAGLTHRHHVGVVTEDRQRLGGQRAGGHVEDGRGQLAGDLVHVGDHQQEPLGGGEGGGQRPALERSVQRPRRASLALHLDHRGHAAPDVRLALARPLVGELGHRRRRRDREDAADLVEPVGDGCGRLVAVDRGAHHCGSPTISMACTGHCSKQVPQPVQRS